MKYFKLPDLGEGLAEAEIVEWHVKPGDEVRVDAPLVSVETAKAIVEVPCPQDGVVAALFGEPGDLIHVGEPLVEFEGEAEDSGTVVGKLQRDSASTTDQFTIGAPRHSGSDAGSGGRSKAPPVVRALAKRLNVDLSLIRPSSGDVISAEDVEKAARLQQSLGEAEALRGVRRTMAINMARSHAEVVPVTLHEDADIHDWPKGTDTTMRLVQAIAVACEAVPALNAWFDGHGPSRRVFSDVHIGIAVDSPEGLFVPVLRDVGRRAFSELREGLDRMRADIQDRAIPPAEMQGATITLSNFGTLAGKYANPVVTPPQVAIVGAGVIREEVVPWQGQASIRRRLPLSLTFDHRAATGGEAARFLAEMVKALERSTLK